VVEFELCFLQNRKLNTAAINKMIPTAVPTPIPAFAPMESSLCVCVFLIFVGCGVEDSVEVGKEGSVKFHGYKTLETF
jgi:hypothetical protein